jgi:hypothetical protein
MSLSRQRSIPYLPRELAYDKHWKTQTYIFSDVLAGIARSLYPIPCLSALRGLISRNDGFTL